MAAKTENAGVNLYINTKGAEASMKELRDDARKLRNELNNMSESNPKFDQLAKNLQKVEDRTEQLKMKVQGTSKVWEFMKSQVVQFGIVAAGFLGFQMLIGQVDNLVKSNYKLSDSYADIRKTTGLTTYEVERLNKELGQLNTRTATKDLRDMAIVAGQLGYSSKKDILDFVKSVDMLNVALGDEFQGGAEQLSKEFGALGRNFKEFKDQKPSDTVLLLGNAINELSASGAATGPIMSDFASRIGGIGGALGLTAGETLGLSATLEELNITAERGGTAVGKILQKMTTNVSEFAEIAGMDVQAFNKMLDEDLYGAFVKVVEGSQKSGSSATALAKVLKDAELQGSGASEVFLKLGNNTDLLSQRVNLANESLKNTNSITNEFNIKNNNFAANVDKVGKAMAGAFSNSSVMNGLNFLVSGLAAAVTPTQDLAKATREEAIELDRAAVSIYGMAQGSEQRTAAINKLKNQYPEYLGYLNAEKVSNEELRIAIGNVNNSLIDKIVLQTKDKEITEQATEAAEKKMELLQAEDTLNKELTTTLNKSNQAREIYNELVDAGVSKEIAVQSLLEDIANRRVRGVANQSDETIRLYEALNDVVEKQKEYNTVSDKSRELAKEREDLKSRLGIIDPVAVTEDVTQKPVKDFVDDAADKKAQKEEEKYLKKLRTRQEAYQKSLDEEAKLALEFDAALEAQESKLAQEAFQRHLAQIDLDAETEKAVLDENALARYEQSRVWMEHDAMAMLEAEQARVNAIYEIERKAIADKLALYNSENDQTGQIRQSLNNKLLFLDNANRRNEIEGEKEKVRLKQALREKDFVSASAVIGNFGKLNAAFMSLAGGDQKEFIAFQKGITLAQIAVDTAKAISSLTANSSANPANAVTFGAAGAAQFVGGLATILANVAQAKQLLSAPEPSAPSFEGGTSSTPIPKFKVGGFNATANPGGYYNSPGLFIAAEAGGEWIAPNWMITDPNYKAIFGALEHDRVNKFAAGGNTSSTATSATSSALVDLTPVVNAVLSLHGSINTIAAQVNAKPVTLSLYELDKAENLKAEIQTAARIG